MYFTTLLEFNVLRYLFFSQTFFASICILLRFFAFFRLLFWLKVFSFNLETHYFLSNFLKIFRFLAMSWIFCSFLSPGVAILTLFWIRDFLSFLFLAVRFFVLRLLFWRRSFTLLRIFYSSIFSGLSFYIIFMLPLTTIFYLKCIVAKEFFVVLFFATLSYLSFSLIKPNFLELNSSVAMLSFLRLSLL